VWAEDSEGNETSMKMKLPDIKTDRYTLTNRQMILLKGARGTRHAIYSETLVSAWYPDGLHRAHLGDDPKSAHLFMSIQERDRDERDRQLGLWIENKPELKPV
jgi:hypothetical protein